MATTHSNPYLLEVNPLHSILVKTESAASPPPLASSLSHFQFKFHTPPLSSGHQSSPQPSEPPLFSLNHLYNFGPRYNFMSQSSWPPSSYPYSMVNADKSHPHHSLPYSDDYDDVTDLIELSTGSNFLDDTSSSIDGGVKFVRRRSSKACDQCRRSKCKCERTSPSESCKSCVLLGTPCTFLGPSRKRGPPKGYIDAIEARLHQTEALLGIIISSRDTRAQSLLRDIGKDPLAREIINRVDNSPYGVKGRKRNDHDGKPRVGHGHQASISESSPSVSQLTQASRFDLTSTHPSNEWQDQVSAILRSSDNQDGSYKLPMASFSNQGLTPPATASSLSPSQSSNSPSLSVRLSSPGSSSIHGSEDVPSERRQRRRLDSRGGVPDSVVGKYIEVEQDNGTQISRRKWSVSSNDSMTSESEDDFIGAMGQLSLNEDEQVRYHGKASGLYLLGNKERVDARNKGGIWRFPKARVWPPLPSANPATSFSEAENAHGLPEPAIQEHLLDLYFQCVHPTLPVVHKRAFFQAFKANKDSSPPPASDSTSPFNRRPRRIPTLLLLAMFAIAARYSDKGSTPLPADPSVMWEAGDEYLNQAKIILDGVYAASRPSTCQALLLMGYREVGIGAMAQAWTYIGMAIRMAQDLGMHRSADGWARAELGGQLFGEWELHERKRIWYACVIMDTYISTYIGRPLMIFERDFDTTLPSEDDPEEPENLAPFSNPGGSGTPQAVPGRIISCFNSSAVLSGLLGKIVEALYAVRPVHSESEFLEGLLDKWYFELPEHLQCDPRSKRTVSPPHVLTLHMQYWCAVLLLHRPFIRHNPDRPKHKHHDDVDEAEVRGIAQKSYELCAGAANHITSIATLYSETYPLRRCAVFLCYYVFTASIMHITSLTIHPDDPQPRMGLRKCMSVLRTMQVVWPSAGRALELLRGAKVNSSEQDVDLLSSHPDRRKRPVEHLLDDPFDRASPSDINVPQDYLPSTYHPQNSGHGIYATVGHEIEPCPLTLSSHINYIPLSSYDKWLSEGMDQDAFSRPLSTSVLPQLYSTGLGDGGSSEAFRYYSQPDHVRTHSSKRYPQYWNDLSTFSQLGTAFGNHQHEQSVQAYPSELYPVL